MRTILLTICSAAGLMAQSGIKNPSFMASTDWTLNGGAAILTGQNGFGGMGVLRLPAGSEAKQTGSILSQGRNVAVFLLRATGAGSTGAVTMDSNWTLGGSGIQLAAQNTATGGALGPWRPKVMTAVTPGGHGVVSFLSIHAAEDAMLDELYLFPVGPKGTVTVGALRGGALSGDAASSGYMHSMWMPGPVNPPLTMSGGYVLLAGYTAAPSPATMNLQFQAMAEKQDPSDTRLLRGAVSVELYNWTAGQWQYAFSSGPMNVTGSPVALPGTMGIVKVPVSQPARFIQSSEQNLFVVRVRPGINAMQCLTMINKPSPCAPIKATFRQTTVTP